MPQKPRCPTCCPAKQSMAIMTTAAAAASSSMEPHSCATCREESLPRPWTEWHGWRVAKFEGLIEWAICTTIVSVNRRHSNCQPSTAYVGKKSKVGHTAHRERWCSTSARSATLPAALRAFSAASDGRCPCATTIVQPCHLIAAVTAATAEVDRRSTERQFPERACVSGDQPKALGTRTRTIPRPAVPRRLSGGRHEYPAARRRIFWPQNIPLYSRFIHKCLHSAVWVCPHVFSKLGGWENSPHHLPNPPYVPE